MATVISPNMNMPVPVVSVEPGPDWATDINASLSIVDSHNHTPGQGVPITPVAINVNTDLPMNNNNLITARTVRFFPQTAAPGNPADIGCLVEIGDDLYFVDGAGNVIRLTQSGAPAGATGTITGLPSGTASASFAGTTFTFQSSTNTPASFAIGPTKIAQAVASGKGVTISANVSQANDYNVTFPVALPASGSSIVSDSSGNLSFLKNTATVYVPTFSAGTVIASNYFFWYYLAPDLIMIQGNFVLGPGSSGTNPMTFSLPNSFMVDNTSYPQGGGTFGNSTIFQTGSFFNGNVSYSGNVSETNMQIYNNYNASLTSGAQMRLILENDLNAGNNVWVSCTVKVV